MMARIAGVGGSPLEVETAAMRGRRWRSKQSIVDLAERHEL